MLKEVGASGQISLGKRFAGQLFEVVYHADGRVEMLPVKAVPATQAAQAAEVSAPDGWLPPGGYAACNTWSLQNRQALDAYASQIEHEGTAAEQLREFLEADPAAARG
jgi:hypothetical protein